jgi:hypothetical protein
MPVFEIMSLTNNLRGIAGADRTGRGAAELINRLRMAGGRPMRVGHPTLPTVAFRLSMRQVDRFHTLLLPLALDEGEPRVF